jgi:hypothetical protein
VSYNLLISRDNALSYFNWDSGHLKDYMSGADWYDSNNITVVSLPLVSNTSNAIQFTPYNGTLQYIYFPNKYDAFYKNFESKNFTIEFWFSLNNSFDGSGYLKNLNQIVGNSWNVGANQYFNVNNQFPSIWSPPSIYEPDLNKNHLEIIKLYNNDFSAPISKIYFDYKASTFRYKFYDQNGTNTEAFIPVRNFNTHFYVVAMYKNGKLKIFVNGEEGVGGQVNDYSLWGYRNSGQSNFVISNQSLQGSSTNFLISDIAFYDYEITKEHQRRRVVLANHMDKPVAITKELNTSIFDFYETKQHHLLNLNIFGSDFNQKYYHSNTKIDDIYGLKSKELEIFSVSDYFPGTSSSITASGLQFYNNISALQMKKFGQEFAKETFTTISSQIILTSSQDSYLFSLPNTVNYQDTLHVRVNASGVFLGSLPVTPDTVIDAFTDSFTSTFGVSSITESLYASVGANLSLNTPYSVGVCFVNNNVYLSLSASPGTASSAVGLISNFNINKETILILGNSTANPIQNNLLYKNFGINNSFQNTFTNYDWSHSVFSGSISGQYVARFHPNTQYDISQIHHWVREVPLSSFGKNILGSKVNWDGMDNCLVQISTDGLNWSTITRGSTGFASTTYYQSPNYNQLLRVVVPYEYSPEFDNQSFNHLNIALYGDTSMLSNDGKFFFSASSDSIIYPAGMIRKFQMPIQTRTTNMGIRFNVDNSGSVHSYGVIYPSSSVIAASTSIYALDFWMKVNSPTSSGTIIDDGLGNTLTYNGTAVYANNGASTYFNGIYASSATLSAGSYVHILYTNPAPASLVYINGQPNTNHINANYGYINVWPYSPSVNPAVTASSRYKSFIGNNITKIDNGTQNVVNIFNGSTSGSNAYFNDTSQNGVFAYRIG